MSEDNLIKWGNTVAQDYMTAEDAADMLGVSVSTLYTYVSRKKLRSVGSAGEKRRLYWRQDIERLRGGPKKAAQYRPPTLGETTAITLITPAGPFYRGTSAVELAEWATVEEVADILWETTNAFGPSLPEMPDGYDDLRARLAALPSSEQAISLFPIVELANPRAHDLSKTGYVRTGADVVRLFAGIMSGSGRPSTEPLHQFIARGLGAESPYDDLIRRTMVLGASHELDPSSYAVRAASNTGVTPYFAAVVGLATFRGRRLLTGRSEIVGRFVDEICTEDDPRTPVLRRFRAGEILPGLGSPIYPEFEPRAAALLGAMTAAIGGDLEFLAFRRAIDLAYDLTGLRPDFILVTAFLRRKLGMSPRDLSTVAVSRIIGWIAHAMEQYHSSDLIRARATYIGILPRASEGEPRA